MTIKKIAFYIIFTFAVTQKSNLSKFKDKVLVMLYHIRGLKCILASQNFSASNSFKNAF